MEYRYMYIFIKIASALQSDVLPLFKNFRTFLTKPKDGSLSRSNHLEMSGNFMDMYQSTLVKYRLYFFDFIADFMQTSNNFNDMYSIFQEYKSRRMKAEKVSVFNERIA